jgi:hypothetical protein
MVLEVPITTFLADPEPGQISRPVFVQPSIREQLAKPFDADPEFIVYQGRPYVVWPMWDYAEDWSQHPIRETHPLEPYLKGQAVTEAAWRSLVRAMHAIC